MTRRVEGERVGVTLSREAIPRSGMMVREPTKQPPGLNAFLVDFGFDVVVKKVIELSPSLLNTGLVVVPETGHRDARLLDSTTGIRLKCC
jgi:hypothetical protein